MNLTVYCGASAGRDSAFTEAAEAVGQWMAQKEIRMIYGGGRTGLMGACADALLAAGGRVTGVIPAFLRTKEQAHEGLTEMITVETMAERKRTMLSLGDAFLALPGGPGTLEELTETYSLYRLGRHHKPVLVYNAAHCYDLLSAYFRAMEENGFLAPGERQGLHFVESVEEVEATLRQAGWFSAK